MLSVGQEFDSFAAFETVKKTYEDKQYVKWVVKKSSSIAQANKRLKKLNPDTTNLYKESLVQQNVEYVCKHGGETRIGTGKGIRPLQSTYKFECSARLHLIATRTKLVVKSLLEEHNHELSEGNYMSLPENRTLDPDGENKARILFEGGVKPSIVRSLLRDQGSGRVNVRDLANLRQKWKQEKLEGDGVTDEQRLVTSLEGLLESDLDATVVIGKDEKDDLKFLLMVTGAMKKNVADFGKVLILDHTYKINRNRMPVCVLMLMDGNGAGRSAGYAFVANEQQTTVTEVLQAFRESVTDNIADKIRTVVIDKDPSEINAAQAVFPQAKVHLCLFHVSKVFKEKISSLKENQQVTEAMELLKYADSEAAFQEAEVKLKACASPRFWTYYLENWGKCPQAWSHRDKKDSITLGNSTTNRVENHNAKIKLLLSYNTTLPDAVEGLLNLAQNKEDDVFFRDTSESLKKAYLTNCSNPVVHEILQDMTRYAARLLIWELENSPTDEEVEHYKASEGGCTCVHRWSFELPCRHMFECRRKLDLELYDKNEIDAMWLKKHYLHTKNNQQGSGGVKTIVMPKQAVPKTHNDKFRMAMQTAKELSSVLGSCGTKQFMARMETFKSLLSLWASGKEVILQVSQPQEKNNLSQKVPCSEVHAQDVTVQEDNIMIEVINIESSDENGGRTLMHGNDRISFEQNPQSSPPQKMPSGENVNEFDTSVDTNETINDAAYLTPVLGTNFLETNETTGASNSELSFMFEDDNIIDLVNLLDRVESGELILEEEPNLLSSLMTKPAHDKPGPSCSNTNVQDSLADNEPRPSCSNTTESDSLSDDEPGLSCSVTTVSDTPLCRCYPQRPTTKFIAGPHSKRPGRPYYACTTRKCNFFRMATSEKGVNKNLFSPFKLPVTVITKGRPKGAGKTTVTKNVQKVTLDNGTEFKKPDGACLTKFQLAQGKDKREKKADDIEDTDVRSNSDGTYRVISQTCRTKWYSVTQDSCTCPDKVNRRYVTCKHMLKIRNMLEDDPKQHSVLVENDPTACTSCNLGEPSHSCMICTRRVHAIEPCSEPAPGVEEGYGKERVCQRCNVKPTKPRARKRVASSSLDAIDSDAGPSIQPKTSRSGRVILKKLPYTPTKE